MSNVIQEFSRFAHQYNRYNIIQEKVAKTLVDKLSKKSYGKVLDVGCGSGQVYKNFENNAIAVKNFIAFDSAKSMLAFHPEDRRVTKIHANFNDLNFVELLPSRSYDLIISSSALQWSNDLDFTLNSLVTLSNTLYAALFTSGTFKTLHKTANLTSPIYSTEILKEKFSQYYSDVSFEIHNYSLSFSSSREMFQYIKRSGVSSGEKKLSYKETKHLMNAYPLGYLEFEVLFVEATSPRS